MHATTVAIDLAKEVFEPAFGDAQGRPRTGYPAGLGLGRAAPAITRPPSHWPTSPRGDCGRSTITAPRSIPATPANHRTHAETAGSLSAVHDDLDHEEGFGPRVGQGR